MGCIKHPELSISTKIGPLKCVTLFKSHNKLVNERTSCWSDKSAALQQHGLLQRRYML